MYCIQSQFVVVCIEITVVCLPLIGMCYVLVEYLCSNDGSSPDESSDDESCDTRKGNLHEVEQCDLLHFFGCVKTSCFGHEENGFSQIGKIFDYDVTKSSLVGRIQVFANGVL